MSTTRRPVQTGSKDTLGRGIRVSDQAANNQVTAPPPTGAPDVDGASRFVSAESALKLHVGDRTFVFPIEGALTDDKLDEFTAMLQTRFPDESSGVLRRAIQHSGRVHDVTVSDDGPDGFSSVWSNAGKLVARSDRVVVLDSRPVTPQTSAVPFTAAERARFNVHGLNVMSAVSYAQAGVRHPEAIVAWAAADVAAGDAGRRVAAGSLGPDDPWSDVRIPMGSFADMVPAAGSVGKSTVASVSWSGRPVTVVATGRRRSYGRPRFAGDDSLQANREMADILVSLEAAGFTIPANVDVEVSAVDDRGFTADSRANAAIAVAILDAAGAGKPVTPFSIVHGDVTGNGVIVDVNQPSVEHDQRGEQQ